MSCEIIFLKPLNKNKVIKSLSFKGKLPFIKKIIFYTQPTRRRFPDNIIEI